MRKTAEYTLMDRVKSTTILHELEVTPVTKKIQKYRNDWKAHVQCMESGRLPKERLGYMPAGKRRSGRPMKKWFDGTGLL